MQVTTERTKTQLDRYGIHTETSHQTESSKFLTVPQKSAIKNLVRGNPLMQPSTVRRNLKNMDSSSHVSPHMTPSVRRLVVHARNDLLATFLDDVEMDGSFGSMERFGQAKWLKTKVQKHNDPEDPYHLNPNEVVVIGKSFDVAKQRVHLNMATPFSLFNYIRALASGWSITIAGDGLYCVCKADFGMTILSAVALGGHHHAICYAIVPGETSEAWHSVWQGVVKALHYLMTKPILCDDVACKFCVMVRGCLQQPDVQAFMRSEDFKSKSNFPVNVAVSDQIKSWPKFVSEAFDGQTKTISCHVHHVGIGHTRNIAKRYMVGANAAALQEQFYALWARSVATPYPELKPLVQKKIFQWLRSVKQPKAAQWFQVRM